MSDTCVPRRFVIFDLGKTNSRLILADLAERRDLDIRQTDNRVATGLPYPHLDVDRIATFLLDTLAAWHHEAPLDGVLTVTHGATVALVNEDGLVLPVLDYEHDGPEETAEAYNRLRPPFSETGSPRMPEGLNIGAQLYWLHTRFPREYGRATAALFWPQFWTWYLTGAATTEMSYASSHTDLWSLETRRAIDEGILGEIAAPLFPPVSPAASRAGTLRPDLALRHGLPTDLPVFTGIHDSSLSLLPYADASPEAPRTILSTGTWIAAFALGTTAMPSDELEGTMVSLDAFGCLVPNFRRMLGRAFADISAAEPDPERPVAPPEDLKIVRNGSGRFDLARRCDEAPARLDAAAEDREPLLGRIIADAVLCGLDAISATGPVTVTGPFGSNVGFIGRLRERLDHPVEIIEYEAGMTEQVSRLLMMDRKIAMPC